MNKSSFNGFVALVVKHDAFQRELIAEDRGLDVVECSTAEAALA